MDIPATSSNIPGTLVLRDASGDFTSNSITTTAPAGVKAEGSSFASVQCITSGANSDASLVLKNDAQDWRIQTQGSDADKLYFYDGTAGQVRMSIHSNGDVTFGSANAISVGSGTQDGATFFNTSTLHISRNEAAPLFLRRRGNDGNIANFYRDTALVGSVSITTTATSYNISSDYRLKENIEPMTGGLTKLMSLNPKTFEFKVEPGIKVDGFIAHEVQTVIPQAVTGEKDGEEMQGLDMSKLVPVLVAAVQELTAKVEALEEAQTQ